MQLMEVSGAVRHIYICH